MRPQPPGPAQRRCKVLVSAYACEPGAGSEPGVGWNWVDQVSRFHEVWVLTRSSNRRAIEAALPERPATNPRWVYFDLPPWLRFWKKGLRGMYPYYVLWQLGAYLMARRLHRRIRFQLVHHVTFANYWLGTLMPWLPVPCVWGPVGGGESCPRSFYASFGPRGRLYETTRAVARWVGEHSPVLRLAALRARVPLATTVESRRRLEGMGCRGVAVVPQVGISRSELSSRKPSAARADGVFRPVSAGRLLHWKGFHLALMAFAGFCDGGAASEYTVIGDGPERGRLERLAERLGVADRVRFCGSMTREQVIDRLGASSVLIHPSLHDSGGLVCLEAMAAGRPVICLDQGGPAALLDAEAGFIVRAGSPRQAVRDITRALAALAADPELGRRMGAAGRRRVEEHFDWDTKGRAMDRIYRDCLAGSAGK